MTLPQSRLYCILDLGYVSEQNAESVAISLIRGGADLLQLRAKSHDFATIERVGRRLLPICRSAGVPFILNDHLQLAAALDADGVHLGQDDGPLLNARALLEPGKIVGRSTHSLEQARAAASEGADYIGFGPLFPTPTKLGRPAIGLGDIRAMESEIGDSTPAFCIGGITPETLSQVLAAGARRVVVVSALLLADDVESATRATKKLLSD